MNPEVFACFSRFSHFLNFGWFWGALTLNFDSVAWFPARGWSQIARTWNIKPIQIFAFIWCSCADPTLYPTASKILPFDTRPGQDDASMSCTGRKIDPKANEWSNFTHFSFWRRNFWICHFSENLRLAPHRPRITLLAHILVIYALRVFPAKNRLTVYRRRQVFKKMTNPEISAPKWRVWTI